LKQPIILKAVFPIGKAMLLFAMKIKYHKLLKEKFCL
jgi:hypothetical protein